MIDNGELGEVSAPICEVFTSLQGEGLYVGQKQLFVRFFGCSLRCNYCDTQYAVKGTGPCTVHDTGQVIPNPVSVTVCAQLINDLWTPSTKMLTLTGGEPLLYPEFIVELASVIPFPIYIETNAAHPDAAEIVSKVVNVAACDVKLPEHEAHPDYRELLSREIESIEVLRNVGVTAFIKVAVPVGAWKSALSALKEVRDKLVDMPPIVLQPIHGESTPDYFKELMVLMDILGKEVTTDVRIIPQIHKYIGVR
ncbi:MAG: 7-carboxy-7-deazaguanine synthase QueE [Methermicoccaceae archaeon]